MSESTDKMLNHPKNSISGGKPLTDNLYRSANANAVSQDVSDQNLVKVLSDNTTGGIQNVFDAFRDRALVVTPSGIINNSIRMNQALSLAGDAINIYASDIRGINKRSMAGWISMAISAIAVVSPQDKQTQEELDSYNEMSTPKYVLTRIGQAAHPFDGHMTQTIGASLLANGALYMGAAFDIAKMGQKKTRMGIITQGGITAAAGGILMFGKNLEKAWQWSTGLFYSRYLVTIPNSLEEYRYVMDHPINPKTSAEYIGNQQQIVAWAQPIRVFMQFTSNCVGFLYGGAYKDKDGKLHRVNGKSTQQVEKIENEVRDTIEKNKEQLSPAIDWESKGLSKDQLVSEVSDRLDAIEQHTAKPDASIATPPAKAERVAEAPAVTQATG